MFSIRLLSDVSSTTRLHFSTQNTASIQMHTDNTLASHGKQVSSDSQAQMPGATQQPQLQGSAANAHLGSKGGAKATQMSHNSSGLKASGQSVGGGGGGGGGVAGMLKLKSKRSASIDCGESRSAAPSVLEADAKGGKTRANTEKCQHLPPHRFPELLSGRSLPELPDYVPPPQQEVITRNERTGEVFSPSNVLTFR